MRSTILLLMLILASTAAPALAHHGIPHVSHTGTCLPGEEDCEDCIKITINYNEVVTALLQCRPLP